MWDSPGVTEGLVLAPTTEWKGSQFSGQEAGQESGCEGDCAELAKYLPAQDPESGTTMTVRVCVCVCV